MLHSRKESNMAFKRLAFFIGLVILCVVSFQWLAAPLPASAQGITPPPPRPTLTPRSTPNPPEKEPKDTPTPTATAKNLTATPAVLPVAGAPSDNGFGLVFVLLGVITLAAAIVASRQSWFR
jgi:hypothetical protein